MANNKMFRFAVTVIMLVALMTLTAFADGFGAIGGFDSSYYAASATINAKGDGLEIAKTDAFQLTDANNKNLAGLYAVSNDEFETQTIVYVYGPMAERKDILGKNTWTTSGNKTGKDEDGDGFDDTYKGNKIKTVGTKTYVVGTDENKDGFDDTTKSIRVVWTANSGDGFYYLANYQGQRMDAKASNTYSFIPGYITGKGVSPNFWGTWGEYYTAVTGSLTDNRNIPKNLLTAFNNATDKEEAFNAIVDHVDEFNYAYALTKDEIIPVSEVNTYTYKLVVFKDDNGFINTDHKVKFDAYVADKNGNITVYSYIHNAFTLSKTATTLIVDFDGTANGAWENNKAPKEGYLVGFRIWPFYGLTDYTKFTVPTAAATNVGHVHVLNSYSIDTPKATKPKGLAIDENGKLTGTIPGMSYEYAVVSSAAMINGTALTYKALEADTTFTAGLYAVRVKGVAGEYTGSDEVYLYVSGAIEDKQALIERTVWSGSGSKTVAADKVAYDENNNPIHPTYSNPLKLIGGKYYVVAVDEDGDGWDDNFPTAKTAYDSTNKYYYVRNYTELRVAASNSTSFIDGKVTAPGISTSFWSGNFRDWAVGVTSGRNISTANITAFKDAQDAEPFVKENLEAAFNTIANATSVKDFAYSYAIPKEKIPTIKELSSYSYKLYFYENMKYEGLVVKFEAYVMDENGVVTPYTYTHNATDVTTASVAGNLNPAVFTVDFGTETNGKWSTKPTSGYLLGFKIWPFYGFTDYTKFTTSSATQSNLMFYPMGGAVIKTAQAAPQVTLDAANNKITVDNFVSGTTYAYSNDEGKSWTTFTEKTVNLPRIANAYYWVKACASDTHYESEITKLDKPTACLLFKGASLVLDGKIGLRFYFDFDASASGNMTQMKFDVFDGTETKNRDFLFKTSHSAWERASFKEDGRTAYITFYTPPKDYDDMRIDTDYALAIGADDSKTYVSNTVGDGFTITRYFEAFYDLVKAGNEECIAANDFVKALEAYCKNADAFFNTEAEALDEVVANTTAIDLAQAPAKSGKITYKGETLLQHHSTSLVLDEAITIRHYFKWNEIEGSSLEGLVSTLDGDITEEVDLENNVRLSTTSDDKYIYVDIVNVNLDNIKVQYNLDLTLGNETISVKYSVLNYIKFNYANSNTKLANLVKTIYNAYHEWNDYPLKEEREKTLIEQRQEIQEAMTLAINTKTVWKEVPEFNPTIDEYSHIKAITYDGLEYKGKKTKIFAYVGFPEGASEETKVPAVVLVHGGGGHPYMEWVRLWNERGYAAIAMETTGYFPLVANAGTIGGTTDTGKFQYGLTDFFAEDGYISAPGPDRLYPTEYMKVSEQWAYHGISQVILAGNILRQDKRVDVDNIGITGISWGGVTTTQVIGYDNRFSFAIPIYGMAYLGDEMRSFTNFNDPYVNALWAAERNLDNATMPIFWFAFNDDNNFGVNQYVKSYNHTKGFNSKNFLSMLDGWGHSHISGWAKKASFYYADWITYGEKGFITFETQPEGREINCKINIPENVTGDITATIYYIDEPMSYSRHDKFNSGLNYIYLDQFWQSTSENITVDKETGTVTGTVPEDAKGYYINLFFNVSEDSEEKVEASSVYVAIE